MSAPTIFSIIFCVSALSGLAALLRTCKPFSARNISSYMLNSGLIGLAMCMFWYKYLDVDNLWMLAGICIILGLGGVKLYEYIIVIMRQGGITITLSPPHKEESDTDEG